MLRKVKIYLLAATAFLITLVAASGVSTASILFSYEPDIPESLKRDL